MKETLKQGVMMKEYEVILAGAGSAGIASFLYALKKGKSFIAAFLDFAIASVVGGAVAGMIFHWTEWPIYVVGAFCTAFGFGLDRVLNRINGIIDAAGDRAEKEIRGLDFTKEETPTPLVEEPEKTAIEVIPSIQNDLENATDAKPSNRARRKRSQNNEPSRSPKNQRSDFPDSKNGRSSKKSMES